MAEKRTKVEKEQRKADYLTAGNLAYYCGPMRNQAPFYTTDFIPTKNAAGTEAAFAAGFCEGLIQAVADAGTIELDPQEEYGPGFAEYMHNALPAVAQVIERKEAREVVDTYLVFHLHLPTRDGMLWLRLNSLHSDSLHSR